MNTHWDDYYKKTKAVHPRPLLAEAVGHAIPGKALDLGCGAGNDTRFLNAQGFDTTSIDSNADVKKHLPGAIIAKVEDYRFPHNTYSVVNAQFTLPFCAPDQINMVMQNIEKSLIPHGLFVGQFFGPEDSWSGRPDMNFHSEAEVREYFKHYVILKFEEVNNEKPTALGDPHHWHVFHVIAAKRETGTSID